MTTSDFRRLALALPEAIESSHMDHPDFRVGKKIFATLDYPAEGWGMVKLPLEKQHELSRAEPKAFIRVKGGWGRRGATSVNLKAAKKKMLEEALQAAWLNTAPPRLKDLLGKKN